MAGPNILSRKRANILSRPSPPPVKFVEEKGKAKSCPFCPETFSTAGDLLRHKNHIHLGILPQECGFCSQDSFRLYGARGHTSYVSYYVVVTISIVVCFFTASSFWGLVPYFLLYRHLWYHLCTRWNFPKRTGRAVEEKTDWRSIHTFIWIIIIRTFVLLYI